jgi:hypothetical protein
MKYHIGQAKEDLTMTKTSASLSRDAGTVN